MQKISASFFVFYPSYFSQQLKYPILPVLSYTAGFSFFSAHHYLRPPNMQLLFFLKFMWKLASFIYSLSVFSILATSKLFPIFPFRLSCPSAHYWDTVLWTFSKISLCPLSNLCLSPHLEYISLPKEKLTSLFNFIIFFPSIFSPYIFFPLPSWAE